MAEQLGKRTPEPRCRGAGRATELLCLSFLVYKMRTTAPSQAMRVELRTGPGTACVLQSRRFFSAAWNSCLPVHPLRLSRRAIVLAKKETLASSSIILLPSSTSCFSSWATTPALFGNGENTWNFPAAKAGWM